MEISESELVKGCLDNNPSHQKELFSRFYNNMMKVCIRYANTYEEAEDILQEGFIRTFKYLHSYKNNGPLGAWIRRVMINTAINHYNAGKIRKLTLRTNNDAEEMELLNYSTDTIAPTLGKLYAEDILKMVQDLSPAYRLVFNLYVVDGFSHAEIAKKLKISEGTSKSNLAKARNKLKSLLQVEFDNPDKIEQWMHAITV